MFKFVVAFALLALATAVPTIFHDDHHIAAIATHHPVFTTGVETVLHPETIQIHEPTITRVGDIVEKIPTAVSHQRVSSVVDHTDVITPIVAPAVKTYTSHVLKAYSTPVVYAAAHPVIDVVHADHH